MKDLFIVIVVILIAVASSSCTRYDGTSTMILEDLDIDYVVMDDIPGGGVGYYSYDEDKVYVKKSKQQVYIILHEVIHKLRADIRLDRRTEEIVACMAAYEVGKRAGLQLKVSRHTLPMWINASLAANGMRPERMTEEYKILLDKEVEKSVQLIVDRLAKKGLSLTDIDYVKTAILLLL